MNESNPHEPLESELEPSRDPSDGEIILRSPRAVSPGRGLTWIAEAFAFFRRYPMPWMVTGLVMIVVSLLSGLIPVVGGVFNTIVTSIILSGVILGCASQEMGEEYSFTYMLVGFNSPRKVIVLSVIYVALIYTILIVVMGPLGQAMVLGGLDPAALQQKVQEQSGAFLIAFALMLPVLMATWFAITLITLHDLSVLDAMRLSFMGSLRNLLPMLVYSIALGFLFFLAVMPLLLGLLIVYPLMLITTYTAYRDIFTHDQVGIE